MQTPSTADVATPRQPRWYAPSPAKFLFAVLVMQGVLFLSSHYRWFWFNERKGFTVLIAVAATAACLVLLGFCVVVSWFWKSKAQFSLVALLLVVPVLSIPCAWLARETELARQQTATVNALLDRNAVLSCRGYPEAKDRQFLTNLKQPEEYGWLAYLFGRDFFAEIFFVYLKEADDADLARLNSLPQLELIVMPGTQVTDGGLALLVGLANLRSLHLDGTTIGDAGLGHLSKLRTLQGLRVKGTLVTDAGLEHLHGLAQLKSVDLTGTRVTDAAVNKLQKAFPQCMITK